MQWGGVAWIIAQLFSPTMDMTINILPSLKP